ncbi:M14 family zinc carboxypeptidase [Solimicrobium silvestre]|uniref:Zinc carboxypeptidase n=1 Tax=Solimicrobium silvestre TaxID=2099400 RepID=A0A2S9H386_9BURK|nr:M14 family zinc carboxypeptidase [Solimicrobium silvestre]PRC94438.1 Zinc carboxypeptidase [Solimicrobium silvestre]
MRNGYVGVLVGLMFSLPVLAGSSTPPKNVKNPINQWCTPLVNRLPKVTMAQCQNSALQASGSVSKKGFPLLIKDVPARLVNNTLPIKSPIKVLLIGGIHGDEKTASAIVFQWLDKLNNTAGNEFHWKIAPVVNPDGLLAAKPTRVNANGVDLNRNFPTPNWNKEALQYWRTKTSSDPRRFPGKAALSEPESRWIFNQMEQFQPDVIISVHAPFGVLDFDGSGTPPSKFGRLLFNRVGVYPGSLGNYGGLHKEIPVVTIELTNSSQMPSDAEIARIWQDMLDWVKLNIPSQAKLAEK